MECLYSPEKFLNDIKKYLCNNGEIIVSCRNVQYMGVLQDLLAGDWGKNKEYSINKETIRFFTLKELEKIFIGLNYKIKNQINIISYLLINAMFRTIFYRKIQ